MRRRLPDSPSRARALRTIAAIERGALPPDLVARIERGGPATSALSVPDAVALASLGGRVVSLVSGASVVRQLHQPMPSPTPRRAPPRGTVQELTVRSDALNTARARAMRRLREEAELAGANAVVGTRIRRAERSDSQDALNLVEVVATGTAVQLSGPGPLVVTTLSPIDLVTLSRSGWKALDLVAASTVCYVLAGRQTIDQFGLTWAQGGTNSEYEDYTRGIYVARSRALGRVEAAAKTRGASGLVGLSYDQTIRPVKREGFGVRDLEVVLHVVATGIRSAGAATGGQIVSAVSVA